MKDERNDDVATPHPPAGTKAPGATRVETTGTVARAPHAATRGPHCSPANALRNCVRDQHVQAFTHPHPPTGTQTKSPLEAAGSVCQQPEHGAAAAARVRQECRLQTSGLSSCLVASLAGEPLRRCLRSLQSVLFPPLSALTCFTFNTGLRGHGPSSLGRVRSSPKSLDCRSFVSASNSCCKLCSFSWLLRFRTCHRAPEVGWLALMTLALARLGLQLRFSGTSLGNDLSGML